MTVGPPPLAPATSAPAGSWWSRHKLWVIVPLAILAVLGSLVLFVFLIVSFVFGLLRSSDAYQQGLSRARANPEVASALGVPVEPAWIVTGNIEVSNDSGTVNVSIPVSGPRGAGTIHVVGTKKAGVWTYSEMDITLGAAHQVIDLRQPAP